LPETLQRDSVAAQGLTALERLLYEDNSEQLLKAAGPAGEWRTQVGLGIARNMSSIADDVVAEWTAPDGVRAAIARTSRGRRSSPIRRKREPAAYRSCLRVSAYPRREDIARDGRKRGCRAAPSRRGVAQWRAQKN
jgi:predicted lipoprotein